MEKHFNTAGTSIAALQYQIDPLAPAHADRSTPRAELLPATAAPFAEMSPDS